MPLGNLSEVNFADSFKAETIRIVEPIAKVLKGKKIFQKRFRGPFVTVYLFLFTSLFFLRFLRSFFPSLQLRETCGKNH